MHFTSLNLVCRRLIIIVSLLLPVSAVLKAQVFPRPPESRILVSGTSTGPMELVGNRNYRGEQLQRFRGSDNLIGVRDSSGGIVLPASYRAIHRIRENHFIVQNSDRRLEVIDRKGRVLTWKAARPLMVRLKEQHFPTYFIAFISDRHRIIFRDSLASVIGSPDGYRWAEGAKKWITAYDQKSDSTTVFDVTNFNVVKKVDGQLVTIARANRQSPFFLWMKSRTLSGVVWYDLSEVLPPRYRRVQLRGIDPKNQYLRVIDENKKTLYFDTTGQTLLLPPVEEE